MKVLILFVTALVSCGAQSTFVHARGREVIGLDGKPLLLRGINLGNWFVPEGYMFRFEGAVTSGREIDALFRDLAGPDFTDRFWREWRDSYVTKADIELIRKAGFNSVRIPLHYALFGEGGAGFAVLDRAIGWCRDAGLLVFLDLHAAPGGQTGTNIDDSWGYPWLYESEAAQAETLALWKRLALRYRDSTTVAGYDLLNEPVPHFAHLQKYNAALEPLYRRIVAAVREVDGNHMVIFGGAQWDSNFKVFGKPFDGNAMYTFHKYWTAPTREVIAEYLDFRDRHEVPLWMGESGENKDEWIAEFTRTLEDNRVGWCYWPYKKMDQASSVVTFARPAHWDEIVAYTKLPQGVGEAEKRAKARPTVEHAREALEDLLRQVKFENRKVNDGYLRALGRNGLR